LNSLKPERRHFEGEEQGHTRASFARRIIIIRIRIRTRTI